MNKFYGTIGLAISSFYIIIFSLYLIRIIFSNEFSLMLFLPSFLITLGLLLLVIHSWNIYKNNNLSPPSEGNVKQLIFFIGVLFLLLTVLLLLFAVAGSIRSFMQESRESIMGFVLGFSFMSFGVGAMLINITKENHNNSESGDTTPIERK